MPLKITNWSVTAVHTIALVPFTIVLAAAAFTVLSPATALDFLPVSGVITDASILLFTLMLACTPLTILFGWHWTQRLKKPLGLYAFMYAGVHYLIFSSAFNFNLTDTLIGSAVNAMLLAGTIGLFLMVPLALTSTSWSKKQLGKNWKRLHKLTYLIALFIVLHVLLVGEGSGLAILYTILLAIRIPFVRGVIVNWRTRRARALQTA